MRDEQLAGICLLPVMCGLRCHIRLHALRMCGILNILYIWYVVIIVVCLGFFRKRGTLDCLLFFFSVAMFHMHWNTNIQCLHLLGTPTF